jgi:co-chaperonin GroES (HSP10)
MENKFKGRALNLIVIVEEVFNENKTASGIDLSEVVDANEKQKRGRVVSIGEQCPKLSDGSFTLSIGSEVIFDKFKMTNFTQDGITYLIIHYTDIVLVF